MDQFDERGGVDTRKFDRFPVDVAVALVGQHGPEHLDGPCVRHQSDRLAVGLRQEPFAEAGKARVHVGHRLAASPADLVDVYAGRRRLFVQVAPGATLKVTECLFAQLPCRCDGQPQLLTDHLGGLLGPKKVGREQSRRAAAARRCRGLAGLFPTQTPQAPYGRAEHQAGTDTKKGDRA